MIQPLTQASPGARIDHDPIAAMPITVVLPADLAGHQVQDLLVRNGVPAEISIELPRGTRYCELQDLAIREGLTLEATQGEIRLSRQRPRTLSHKLRDLLCRPQAF